MWVFIILIAIITSLIKDVPLTRNLLELIPNLDNWVENVACLADIFGCKISTSPMTYHGPPLGAPFKANWMVL